ncbi:MAG TPA: phenylalanine--tRNA ligase subunit beta [Acidisarcina sp.]
MKILTQWLREYLPELAITDAQLAEDLTLRGIAVDGVFALPDGQGSLFEMDITTNRVDAMNHYGIAREMGAIYDVPLRDIDASLPAPAPTSVPFSVRIEEPSLCGRFTARVIRNVSITPSTGIVAHYFRLLEQKQISNAVDATNYVTLAIGQPTHAFDLDKITGGLIIRRARKGERLRTLDGIERTLDPEDLIVADDLKPLAIAGVMGGYDTMITAETRNIVVEAAWFDPAAVRRSSRRHGLHTDASHRFERGADFNAPPLANALVSRIILSAGGHPEGDLIDIIIPAIEARTAKRPAISVHLSEVHRILGKTEDPEGITAKTTSTVLKALGCSLNPTTTNQQTGNYEVQLPSWRLDLEREIDLIEEIARVYGYNRFANTLPPFAGAVVELPWAAKESTLRRTLLASGYTESISSTFCSATEASAFAPQPNSGVPLGNPLSEEAGMLRPSLIPGMINMLQHNLNRDVPDAALFEMGTVFAGTTDSVNEQPSLAIGATGRTGSKSPSHQPRPLDFYDLKGAIESLLSKFTSRSIYYDAFPAGSGHLPEWLHPTRSARAVLDGATVGYFGQLHPAEAHRRKLKQPIFLGEFYLDRLYRQPLRQPIIAELSRYQAVRRDYSFLFADTISWAAIDGALKALAIPDMQGFEATEILRDPTGARVPKGSYSILISAVFQSPDRTLREEELQDFSQRIIAALQSLGGHLRSSASPIT